MRNLLLFLCLAFANLTVAQMPNTLSNADKIYGLSKFWQEVNYNFIYLDKVDQQMWDSTYQAMITEVQNTQDDYEYYRSLQRFCALLKDGHTNVDFPRAVNDEILNTYFGNYRLFMTNIAGRAIVTRVNASKKAEIPIGTEVTKVNDLPTAAYLEQYVKPYLASSTDYVLQDMAVRTMFAAPKGTSFKIEFSFPDGKRKTMTLTHTEVTEKEVYPPFVDRDLLDFRWLEDDIAYVALNGFDEPKIDTLFTEKLPELYRAKKLIIDLRNNGGGMTWVGRDILQHLVKDEVLYGSKNYSRLHIPSFKAWGKWTAEQDTVGNDWNKQAYLSYRDQFYHEFPYEPDTINNNSPRIVVPTVLLIGHNTASAAEDFLISADNQTHMTKIGEPSFGSTGQPMFFDLPGGGSARVCTKKDTYPDGREFVGYGVQPDILVSKTLADFVNDDDPALERALIYLKEK